MSEENDTIYVELCRVSRNIDSSQNCSSSPDPAASRSGLAPGIIQHWGLLVKKLHEDTGACLNMELYDAGRVQKIFRISLQSAGL